MPDPIDHDDAQAPDAPEQGKADWSPPTLTAVVPVSETRGGGSPDRFEGLFYTLIS